MTSISALAIPFQSLTSDEDKCATNYAREPWFLGLIVVAVPRPPEASAEYQRRQERLREVESELTLLQAKSLRIR